MSRTKLQSFNMNLTAAQFEDMEVADALTQFAESPEGPDKLTVEITNLTDSQTTRRISSIYRAAHVDILIDDVGSDNSIELVQGSLPYINGMKFAMQNLRKSMSNEELYERVKFWRELATKNNLDFILEGVETDEDLELARKLNVRFVQGYYFGKPEPAGKKIEQQSESLIPNSLPETI
ncbi:EAL domain-containing protein [Lacticaseibacillus hulanensis]|uniref:EAL domain-containing protein n=1 Tax=Lacticaseibacillus hulanensis TaxID=2493111 RepID=UPI000FD9AE07|nr:EAL domain-containing protein [Lacticaseibacillus hulanensis]